MRKLDLKEEAPIHSIFCHVGVQVTARVFTSLSCERDHVEMCVTPIGVHVHFIKSQEEYVIPYSNIHSFKLKPA